MTNFVMPNPALKISTSNSPLMQGGCCNEGYLSPYWAVGTNTKGSFHRMQSDPTSRGGEKKRIKLGNKIECNKEIELQNFLFGTLSTLLDVKTEMSSC